MDPLSLSSGILPMIGNSVNVYKSVRAKLKIFCHYSAEVDRVRKLFGAQRDYFLNEIELVLRLVIQDEDIIKSMMKDSAHAQWQDDSLHEKLQTLAGRNMESLMDIISGLNESITALQEAFQCFAPLEEDLKQNERLKLERKQLKESIRELKKRFAITFEKKHFDDQIHALEKSNNDLRRLREQISELQKPLPCAAKQPYIRPKRLPLEFGTYGTIRRASKALYEALTSAWSSTKAPQLRHFVKLFLDTKVEADVQMEIAILCCGAQLQQTALLQATLTRLEVRSRTMDSITWSSANLLVPPSEANVSKNARRKRQRVRFSSTGESSDVGNSDAEVASVASTAATTVSQSSVTVLSESQLTGHFCAELEKRCSTPDMMCKAEGLGHIDSCMQEGFRHCFFPCSNTRICGKVCLDDVMPMSEVLGQSAGNRLSVVGQLRLAHRLVSAVLKFNSTPWLNEAWSVRDLAFFRKGDDLTSSLQTLHFGVELVHGSSEAGDSLMDIETPESMAHSTEDVHIKLGVRNITLHSLGAALLAIGRLECIDHNDIEAVRRLAAESSYLGPAYQELTEKVLECDFGYGKDLKKPRLQEAIYEIVVLKLESMIASLEGLSISDE